MSPSADAAAWKRLGELLTRRRVELDPRYSNRTIFSAERGLDYRLAYDIEEARRENFRTTTLTAIAAAYAVTADSVFAVLRDSASRLEPAPGSAAESLRLAPAPPVAAPHDDDDEAAAEDELVRLLAENPGDPILAKIAIRGGAKATTRLREAKGWLGVQADIRRNGTTG